MARYDRLPHELRQWLSTAALPWSPQSALKVWTRACRDCGGDTSLICRHLDRAEARLLKRDAAVIWGADDVPGSGPASVSGAGVEVMAGAIR